MKNLFQEIMAPPTIEAIKTQIISRKCRYSWW